MTIDIPGDKVFVQRDVRETPAATATATSVGLTTPQYLTLALDADLVNERVLTAGEGIDFTDTGANGTLTINGELATDTGNKGIATFTASDFDVASGVVTIDDSGVDHDGTTNFLVAEHRNWESSIAQNIHADNYTDTGDTTYTAGEGLDLVGTVFSGENASDSGNKGIASFNPSDFDVTNGAVSIDDSGIDHGAIGNTHNMTTDIDARMTAGEGINYVTGTISAETASETNRGIATFDGDDFNVNTGDVTLKATVLKTIDGDSGTATPSVHNIDILGGDGISTVGSSNDITITADITSATVPPIGAIVAWNKSMTGVPQTLPSGWRECDGTAVNDGDSPMNGQNMPDLDGGRFLRGNTTSEGTGGSATMAHTHTFTLPEADIIGQGTEGWNPDGSTSGASNEENRPPFFDVVWIMRIK